MGPDWESRVENRSPRIDASLNTFLSRIDVDRRDSQMVGTVSGLKAECHRRHRERTVG